MAKRKSKDKKEDAGLFSQISISNFRCFNDISIESLQRVNLIAGTNSVGKTTLLEAIFLLAGASNLALVVKLSAFRGMGDFKGDSNSIREALWSPLFFNFDNQLTIKIEGNLWSGGKYDTKLQMVSESFTQLPVSNGLDLGELGTASLSDSKLELKWQGPQRKTLETEMTFDEKGPRVEPVPPQPPFPGHFITSRLFVSPEANAERFGKLEIVDDSYSSNLLEVLKKVEPRLKRLSTIVSAGVPMIWGDIGIGRMLPLPMMGEGIGRLSSILLAISSSPRGIVLIDEVENGFHHSVLHNVWRAIAEAACRFDAQIFATTHSWECISAAHKEFEASEDYDFRLHRLDRVNDIIKPVTYSKEALSAAIKADFEVR